MISGVAHPPRSSERCEAILDISQPGKVVLNVNGCIVSAYSDSVEFVLGVGSSSTKVRLPDGWQFIADTNEELDFYLRNQGEHNFIGKLEKNITAILVSCALLVTLTVGMFTHGIPWLTDQVVAYLPDYVPKIVEEQVLESLDQKLFDVSELPLERQASICQRFEYRIQKMNKESDVQLVFRSSDLGANAFALSGGTIVVLDDLVRLTQTSEQLDSIIMHEYGHIEHQHVMKSLVRSGLLSLTVATLTGETSGVIDNLAGLGVFVANNGHSQDAEKEADAFASKAMVELHGTNQPMIEMFELLRGEPDEYTELPAWLSSHPELNQRIESLEGID